MCIEHGAADNEVDRVGVDEVCSIGLALSHSLGVPGNRGENSWVDAGLAGMVLHDGWNYWRWVIVSLWIDVMEHDKGGCRWRR